MFTVYSTKPTLLCSPTHTHSPPSLHTPPAAALPAQHTAGVMTVETKRFDGRLDSFLRRTLSLEEYERVVSTEQCVVVTAEGKRAPRNVVLGHRWLYFTEIPPKTLTRALQLENIVSVETVRKSWLYNSGCARSVVGIVLQICVLIFSY